MLTEIVQILQCEVLTDSRNVVEFEVLTGRGRSLQCELLKDNGQAEEYFVLTDS